MKNRKKRSFFSFLYLGLFILVVLVCIILFCGINKDVDVVFTGKTENNVISIEWKIPANKAILSIDEGDGYSRSQEYGYTNIEYVNGTGNYTFTNGTHGKRYSFRLRYVDASGKNVVKTIKRMFLNFDKLPSLLTFYINTKDGIDPTYENAVKPDRKLYGKTIINNKYKDAILNGNTPVKIRIRGNASADGEKKPYKLVFDEEIDLLDLGPEYADTEWVLLGLSQFKSYFGFNLGKIVGMEWEPRMRFVNVMLNDDWKGLYALCEAVKPHSKRLPIKKNGYLIESDVYFWKEQDKFFASDLFEDRVRFTFKYPKVSSGSDIRLLKVQDDIKKIEKVVWEEIQNVGDVIDFDTFAAWELAHEFMGTMDGLGSNMYFYKYDMDETGAKLKMGPLWDFDSIFHVRDKEHPKIRFLNVTYFPFLLEDPAFRQYYKDKYFSIAPQLESKMHSVMEDLKNIPGLEESVSLDINTFGPPKHLDSVIDGFEKHLHQRINWLNTEMENL